MPANGHSGRFRLSTLQIIALLATGAALIAGVVSRRENSRCVTLAEIQNLL